MKFTVSNVDLKNAVGRISSLVEKKTIICSSKYIKFEAANEGVYLYAISSESYGKVKVDGAKVYEIGEILVELPDVEKVLYVKDIITIETNERYMIAYNGKKKSKVCTVECKEFVEFPVVDCNSDSTVMTIANGRKFCEELKLIGECRTDNEAKPIYTGFNFRSDERTVCTTDGYRMIVKYMDGFTENEFNIVVAGRAEKELTKLIGKSEQEVKMYSGKATSGAYGGYFAVFVGNDFEYMVKLLDGIFLDWKKAMMYGEGLSEFTFVNEKVVIETLKEYIKLNSARIQAPCIMTEYDGNLLTYFKTSEYETTDCIEIDGNLDGEMFVGVNPKYMLGMLNMFDKVGEKYRIRYYGTLKPIVMSGGDYICLVLPINVRDNYSRESIIAYHIS